MAKKETTTTAAQTQRDICRKRRKKPTAQSDQNQRTELANLQDQAAKALNALWVELRKQGYMAYNTILLLGIAFEVKKDENNDFYFVPNDLTRNSIYRKDSEEEERSEAEVIDEVTEQLNQPADQTPKRRNISPNRGRSIEAGRNDNTPFKG